MGKKLTTVIIAFLCCLFVGAQPFARPAHPRAKHHTHRLPGVNERRLARLEKMRQANLAVRHPQGPLRVQAQPETKRGLVLLVEFSDVKMMDGASAQWTNRFNQQGFSLNNHVGSVRDYFLEQSYGLLSIDFDVVGPLTLSQNRKYYGSAPNNILDDRAAEMVIEALGLADSIVNYADYDWNNDREVDQVYVIFAGESAYGVEGYIWPHEWSLYAAKYYGCGSGYQRMDNVIIDTYAVSNELAYANTLQGIGTACHEFSHCLGYPDFYDTEYTGGTAAQYWDVLDAGSYNGPQGIGEVPSPYTAYERWTAGWIDLIPLTDACKVNDMPAINEEGVAYVIKNSGNTDEYYILENRQKVGFGTGNGGHGLMVWHIDYNQAAWQNNTVNADKDHQRMTFLPADAKVGDLQFDQGQYYYQVTFSDESGDPYPGSQKVKNVQQLTWFTAEKGGTKRHGNLIHDISESSDGKISFIYGDYIALPTPELAMPTNIMETSFTANWQPVEGATSYTLQVEAMTGEEAPATVLSENFSGFSNAAADAVISNSLIDRYTQTEGWEVSNLYGTRDASVRVGSAGATGYFTTPTIPNSAGTLIVEFDAASFSTDVSSVAVSVFKGNQTIAAETVPLTGSRATYSCTFEDVPSGCNVRFASTARRNRFYIYNVNIMDMSGAGSKVMTYSGLTTTSYIVDALEADMYYYRVQAVCDEGPSEWSDWMDVDIAAPISVLPEGNAPDGEAVNGKSSDGIFYDFTGRRLPRVPQRGIYIQGDKIYMAH